MTKECLGGIIECPAERQIEVGQQLGCAACVLARIETLETERDKATSQARTDILTGLPNRLAFMEQLFDLRAQNAKFGLIAGDVKNLKYVNDAFGHLTGDFVLKVTGEVLQKSTRSEDDFIAAARLGGDEFAVLASTVPRSEAVTADPLEGLVVLAHRLKTNFLADPRIQDYNANVPAKKQLSLKTAQAVWSFGMNSSDLLAAAEMKAYGQPSARIPAKILSVIRDTLRQ